MVAVAEWNEKMQVLTRLGDSSLSQSQTPRWEARDENRVLQCMRIIPSHSLPCLPSSLTRKQNKPHPQQTRITSNHIHSHNGSPQLRQATQLQLRGHYRPLHARALGEGCLQYVSRFI